MPSEDDVRSEMDKRLGNHDRRLDSQEKDIHSISLLTKSIESSVRVMVGVQQDDRVLQAENLVTLKAMQKSMDVQAKTTQNMIDAKDTRIDDCKIEYNSRLNSLESFRTWMYRSVMVGIFVTVASVAIAMIANPKAYMNLDKPTVHTSNDIK